MIRDWHAHRNDSLETGTQMTPDSDHDTRRTAKLELTAAQVEFLLSLSQGAIVAAHKVDASMVGPLIRANLVRWEDDAAAAARRRLTPGSTFTLTHEGAQVLLDRGVASGNETG